MNGFRLVFISIYITMGTVGAFGWWSCCCCCCCWYSLAPYTFYSQFQIPNKCLRLLWSIFFSLLLFSHSFLHRLLISNWRCLSTALTHLDRFRNTLYVNFPMILIHDYDENDDDVCVVSMLGEKRCKKKEKKQQPKPWCWMCVCVFSGPIVQSSRTDENSVTFIRTKMKWFFAVHCRHHSQSRRHRRQHSRSKKKNTSI